MVTANIRRLPDGRIEAHTDIALTVEALFQTRHTDTILLVTGNDNFRPLVDTLVADGKRVVVIGPGDYCPELMIMMEKLSFGIQAEVSQPKSGTEEGIRRTWDAGLQDHVSDPARGGFQWPIDAHISAKI